MAHVNSILPLDETAASVFQSRKAGILLHPSSLPGEGQLGCLDKNALQFIDFLHECGFKIWQTLPVGPTHDDLSPYNCISVFALNPRLLSVEWMSEQGLIESLPEKKDKSLQGDIKYRRKALLNSFENRKSYGLEFKQDFDLFVSKNSYWINNYALYSAIRDEQHGRSWMQWPDELRDATLDAIQQAESRLSDLINLYLYEQFLIDLNWQYTRQYAQKKDIVLFGDLPMFVAFDSAEVWGQRKLFTINDKGEANYVAGVPPDYFSETGQYWGNPQYEWKYMQDTGFEWWIQRLSRQFELFDIVRIDHFRGFESSWTIPGTAKTAMEGKWEKVPGDLLFRALRKAIPDLPVVAEDLGVITQEVVDLRHKHKLPGMKVLQFGFDGNETNPHLPNNYESDFVVYTGTHDNDTSLSWYESLNTESKKHVNQVIELSLQAKLEMPWSLIVTALNSKAQWAIVPMQDLLALNGEHRMNTPGTVDNNWLWRFEWDLVRNQNTKKIKLQIEASKR